MLPAIQRTDDGAAGAGAPRPRRHPRYQSREKTPRHYPDVCIAHWLFATNGTAEVPKTIANTTDTRMPRVYYSLAFSGTQYPRADSAPALPPLHYSPVDETPHSQQQRSCEGLSVECSSKNRAIAEALAPKAPSSTRTAQSASPNYRYVLPRESRHSATAPQSRAKPLQPAVAALPSRNRKIRPHAAKAPHPLSSRAPSHRRLSTRPAQAPASTNRFYRRPSARLHWQNNRAADSGLGPILRHRSAQASC